MRSAVYLNGVFESVLKEIMSAQEGNPERVCYLQPYSHREIALLSKSHPTPHTPIRLYISLTDSLAWVSYRALIVGWRNKRNLAASELDAMNEHILRFQRHENEIYFTQNGKTCTNLISIVRLERLASPFHVSCLKKTIDLKPLKERRRSGSWSYVEDLPEWIGNDVPQLVEQVEDRFEKEVDRSSRLTDEARRERLRTAPKIPESISIISRAFQRNPDVHVEILKRADGKCERCGSYAPFLRASDGTPYLEVHHRITLANGGEDTVENAVALCPNCHCELHFGRQ